MSENRGFLKGLLAGGLIGAAFALLYAPKTGRETREDLKRKSRELYDEADNYLGDVKERAAKVVEDGKQQAELLRQQADARLREARAKADQLIARGKQKAGTLSEEAESRLADVKAQAQSIIDEGKKRFGRKDKSGDVNATGEQSLS